MGESLKQKTINGILWSSLERFSVQGVTFALGLVIARLLSPDDYGVIAMLTIFISISSAFVDSGFSTALVRKLDRDETDNSTAFYFNIAVGIVAYLILFFLSPFIARFYDTPILEPVTKVFAISLFVNSLCVVQQAILTVRIDFKTQAKISLSAAIISGMVGIIMAYYGYGVWALVAQTLISAVVRALALWILVRWIPTRPFSIASFRNLFGFGSKLLASGILDITYNNLYIIIIGKIFNASSLGNYTRANQFAQFPSSNITSILQRVTFPVLSSIQNEDDRLRSSYRQILRLSAFVAFPLMVGLSVVSRPTVLLLLTDKWSEAIPYLQIICFAFLWYPIHAINLNLLTVKGRSDLFLRVEVIKKIIGVAILCATVPLGILAMCYGQVVSSVLCLVINTHYTGKLIQVGFVTQMRDLLPIFLLSLIMGAVAWSTMLLSSHYITQICIAVVSGGIVYLLLAKVTQLPELSHMVALIRKRKI